MTQCNHYFFLGIEENLYFLAGQICAMSIIHGGPNPNFLAPIIVKKILGEDFAPLVTDIPESEFQQQVFKV
jgi:hypothetical protein